ncbi:MAG: N-acetyltransferase [Gemmatimonadales bacterium]|nr:N-acetyltransferase [Gemmatimonadales bacterium]
MIVRDERPADTDAIRRVHLAAFETGEEAGLVDRLRGAAAPRVSLVAEADGDIVGHILFSPMTLDAAPALRLMGLAPMAVLPARQRAGVGSALVASGLAACRALGADAVAVLGHAAYYPRFGFLPASRFGLRAAYDVPDDCFMALELRPGALASAHGVARYHPAFDEAEGGSSA